MFLVGVHECTSCWLHIREMDNRAVLDQNRESGMLFLYPRGELFPLDEPGARSRLLESTRIKVFCLEIKRRKPTQSFVVAIRYMAKLACSCVIKRRVRDLP